MGVGMPAPPSALEIARALIRFPSVTPADGGALPYLRDLLGKAGFATELVTFEAPGTPAVLNLYARFGVGSAQSRLRRPHRRRAAGRQGALAVRPVLGRNRRRRALGPRRLRHEGRRRRLRRRRLALHRQGRVRRLNQLPHHRRRGRPGGQRHGQARRLGARQGGDASTIASWANRPPSRRSATRSSTAGAARSTDGSPSAAARATRLIRISPTIRFLRLRPY